MALPSISINLPDDESIRQAPISESRRQRLFEDYLRERRLTRTTEMLFARVDALEMQQLPATEPVREFGFKAIMFKHSFVEDVDWLIVSAQGWAVGQEDFLLKYFGESLRDATDRRLEVDVRRDVPAILEALEAMADELRGLGFQPSAFVVTGSLGQPLYEALQSASPRIQNPWEWYRQRTIQADRASHRFIGVHAGIPLVAIEAVRTPMLYAVDLARFATLTRYGVGPHFDPEFSVKVFTDEDARRVLARQPNLILDPPPSSGQDDERIRQLQLRVGLELWETYRLDVKDPGAVIARPLADPAYE